MNEENILYQKKLINVHACFIVTTLMVFPFLGVNMLIDDFSDTNNIVYYSLNVLLIITTIYMVVRIYRINTPILYLKENELKVSKFLSFMGKATTIVNLFKLLGNKLNYSSVKYDDIAFFETVNNRGDSFVALNYFYKKEARSTSTGISLLSKKDIRVLKDFLKEKQKLSNSNFKIYNF